MKMKAGGFGGLLFCEKTADRMDQIQISFFVIRLNVVKKLKTECDHMRWESWVKQQNKRPVLSVTFVFPCCVSSFSCLLSADIHFKHFVNGGGVMNQWRDNFSDKILLFFSVC